MAVAGRVEHQPKDGVLRELALSFISLQADQIGPAIQDAQARLVRVFDLNCCVLMEMDHSDPRKCTPISTYSYPPFACRGDQSSCPPGNCRACLKVLSAGMAGILLDGDQQPDTNRNGEASCIRGCRSVVGFPLLAGERTIGAVVFAAPDSQPVWQEEQVAQLEFVAQVFASALARKRAGQDGQLSEQYCRELMERVKAIVWRADANTLRASFISKAVESILGYAREELMQSRDAWVQRVHPEDRQRVREFVTREVEVM